jgi:hypothetical protein
MNKENVIEKIIYTIVIVLALEHTRIRYNRIEKDEKLEDASEVTRKQKTFVFKMALLYSIILTFFALKSAVPLIKDITQTYDGMQFLTSNGSFALLLFGCYFLAVFISYKLLGLYIRNMNKATWFFTKLGRSVFDGSLAAMGKVADAGSSAVGIVADAGSSAAKMTVDTVSAVGKTVMKPFRSNES